MRIVNLIFWTLLGAIIYGFTLGSSNWIDYAIGAAFAMGIGAMIRPFMQHSLVSESSDPHPAFWKRLLWTPVFLLAVVRDILIGTWDVIRYTIGLRSFENAGIVRVPLNGRTRTGVAVSAWAITVAPGSAFVDVDWEAGDMLVHVLEADDGDQIRKTINTFYNRYQKRVFP